jgi:hypothetical protein
MVQGVPMGIVESLNETVPDAASEKRLASAGMANAKKVNNRRAVFAQRAIIAVTVLIFW